MICKIYRRIHNIRAQRQLNKQRQGVSRILALPQVPSLERSEAGFASLQARYQPRPEYGYDAYSIFFRASERALTLLRLPGLSLPGLDGLDLGAGDGMVDVLLQTFGHRMMLSDMDDWRVDAAKQLSLVKADCSDYLPLPENCFDFVVSFNAFEHFPNPARTMDELIRVTHRGGLMYFSFNPLYCSPWGLHAYRSLRMPYPQFLFSEMFIDRKLEELGIWDLGKQRSELQSLNRWRFAQYKAIWERPELEMLDCKWHIDDDHLDLILEYPECFQGRGLKLEDVVNAGVTVTLRKR
jgi:SAM-dependent methyltransferase